jgi:hypothetical protein
MSFQDELRCPPTEEIKFCSKNKPELQSISGMNISQICSLCLYCGSHLVTYLKEVVLVGCPLEQLRLTKLCDVMHYQLVTLEKECNKYNRPIPKFFIHQITATTAVRQRCDGEIKVVKKNLFEINTNLENVSLLDIHPVNLVQLFISIIYQGLHCISGKLLLTERHPKYVMSLVRDCIHESLQMQDKMTRIFTSLPFSKASTKVKIRDLISICVKIEVFE